MGHNVSPRFDDDGRLVPTETSWIGRALRLIEREGRPAFSEVQEAIPECPRPDELILAMLRDGWAIESVPGYLSLSEDGEAWCRS